MSATIAVTGRSGAEQEDDDTCSEDLPLARICDNHPNVGDSRQRRNFSFEIPSCDFERFRPITTSGKHGFRRGWADVVYGLVHKLIPTCAFKFDYNNCSRASVRNSHFPYWSGRGVCPVTGCMCIYMTIDRKPLLGESPTVNLTAYGICQHTGDDDRMSVEEKKRKLTGQDRRVAAQQILSGAETPLTIYHRRLRTMTDEECLAGNATECQNTNVFAMAASQARASQRLHHDAIVELDHYRCAWLKSSRGEKK